jgi:hypothetical protein
VLAILGDSFKAIVVTIYLSFDLRAEPFGRRALRMSGQQKTFSDIEHEVDARARELFRMPTYGQVDENLVNMANYFPLIEPLINALEPSSICEIGSDQGMTTTLLTQYCKKKGSILHSVDPCFPATKRVDENTYLHSCLSTDYLASAEFSDIYFLDGDHNYYTVSSELKLICTKKPSDQPCIIFLHDVGWPWGKFDMYYDQENIPESHRKATTLSPLLSLFTRAKTDHGEGLPMSGLRVALSDDQPTGISAAIEELLEAEVGWEYMAIPSVFGLGILFHRGGGAAALNDELDRLKAMFERFNPFLSILEFNRIALLEKINQSGFIWAQQQGVIREYGQEIQNLEKRIEGFKSSNSTLEGDYKDLQAANEKMVTEIDALETHIKQLESKPVLEVERKLARFFGRIKCWLWKTEK